MRDELSQELEALFRQCAAAHHRAFAAVDGADPEWPEWYAEYLQHSINALLGREIAQRDLAGWLVRVEETRARDTSGVEWPVFYASELLASDLGLEA